MVPNKIRDGQELFSHEFGVSKMCLLIMTSGFCVIRWGSNSVFESEKLLDVSYYFHL